MEELEIMEPNSDDPDWAIEEGLTKRKRGRPRTQPITEDMVFKEFVVKRKPGRPKLPPLSKPVVKKLVECPWPGCGKRFRQKGNMKTHFLKKRKQAGKAMDTVKDSAILLNTL